MNFKKLALSLIFISAFAMNTMADGEPECIPGQTSSPPCAVKSVIDDSAVPGKMPIVPGQPSTPPASDSVDLVDIGQAVLWALSLF